MTAANVGGLSEGAGVISEEVRLAQCSGLSE